MEFDKVPIDNCRIDVIYYHTDDIRFGHILIKINDDGTWVLFDSLHLHPDEYLDGVLAHINKVIELEQRERS